jgi:chemotaxis protein methyltransferase CheR
MRVHLETEDVERFRAAMGRCFGLSFDDSKLGFLGAVLERRLDANRKTAGAYLGDIEGPRGAPNERRELARELTVPETYFFRHFDQFRAFDEVALPGRLAARSNLRELRVLSAGCASGEEAYSLAIVVRERVLERGWNVSIRAIDINASMLERARQARYSAWALRETPEEIQRRWFVADGREFMLDREIRAAVTLEESNLAEDDPGSWQPDSYDAVFCRNVIMYFTPEKARALITRITRALAPGGYLFLGHAETLRGLSQDFHLLHTHGTFYYQRKLELEHSISTTVPTAPLGRSALAAAVDFDWAATWVETIQRASDRIRTLAEERAVAGVSPARAESPIRADLGDALELLRGERYAEALVRLDDLPRTSARDPDVLLLRASLLTHRGELNHAEEVCAELLELDELSAGAHYLLALCREGRGDTNGAVDHDQVAAYLDETFVMPRRRRGTSPFVRRRVRSGGPHGAVSSGACASGR